MKWQIKKLGEICDFEGGSQPPKSKFVHNLKNGYVRFLQIRDFKSDKNITYIPESKKNRLCIKEDILIGRYGASVGQILTNEEGAYNVALMKTMPNKNVFNKDFFYYYLISDEFQSRLAKVSARSAQAGFSKDDIYDFPVLTPPIPEQKRIVKILDEVFGKVEKAKENAEKNLNNSKELFESYLQSVFADNAEQKKLGDKNLLQIIDGDRGKNYPKKSDFLHEGFCLFLNTKNVRPDGFDFQTTMFITEKKDNALGNGKLQRNDVLLTTRGTIGNIAVYNKNVSFENIRINSGMLIFRPNTKLIIPEYLFAIFQSVIMKSQIKKYVSGAAQPQLPIKTLVNFSIPVPKSLSEQKTIVKKLDALSAKTKKLEKIYERKLADLEELKKSVLSKAFKGEL